jgi:hypothetical protein
MSTVRRKRTNPGEGFSLLLYELPELRHRTWVMTLEGTIRRVLEQTTQCPVDILRKRSCLEVMRKKAIRLLELRHGSYLAAIDALYKNVLLQCVPLKGARHLRGACDADLEELFSKNNIKHQ